MMIRFTSNDEGYLDCEHYLQSDSNIVTKSVKPISNLVGL